MFSPWSMNCTLFRCRLCGKIFLFTIDTVHSHLKRSHKISWDTYKQKYLCSDRDGLLMDLPLQVFFYSKRFLMTIFLATGNRHRESDNSCRMIASDKHTATVLRKLCIADPDPKLDDTKQTPTVQDFRFLCPVRLIEKRNL